MANMLYNGVELPELPNYGDYKYIFIQNAIDTLPFYLKCYNKELVVNIGAATGGTDIVATSVASTSYLYFTVSGDGSWTLSDSGTLSTRGANVCWPTDLCLWTNFDLKYNDGTIFMAASTPVPVGGGLTLDADFWRFFAIGQALRPVLWRKREATMYSYNGVVLPGLPESEFPYATIFGNLSGESEPPYTLFFTDVQASRSNSLFPGASFEKCHYSSYLWNLGSHEWIYQTGTTDNALSPLILPEVAYWSNYDIQDTVTGTVYLEASDPIPVYE